MKKSEIAPSTPLLAAMLVVAALFGATATEARSVEEYKWIEVRTQNFVVRSLHGESRTEKVARHLEMVKAILPDSLQTLRRTRKTPETIYLVKGDWQLKEMGYSGNLSSYSDFDNEKYMVIADDRYPEYTAARAYMFYLVGEKDPQRRDLWFQAGLNIIVGSATVKQGKFWYGAQRGKVSRPAHVLVDDIEILLSDIDYSDMSDGRRQELSANSWMLVRYLIDRRDGWQQFSQSLSTYITTSEQSSSVSESFEAAFGIPTDELGERLSEFSMECCAQRVVRIENLVADFEPVTTKVSERQIAQYLAEIAADFGDEKRAGKLRNKASAGNGE